MDRIHRTGGMGRSALRHRFGRSGVQISFNVMKTVLIFAVASFSAGAVQAQGTIDFNNISSSIVRAPIYGPEPSDPTVSKVGNTSDGIPAGNQTYGGALLAGTGFMVQL